MDIFQEQKHKILIKDMKDDKVLIIKLKYIINYKILILHQKI
jgi:hypothetical protein